MSQHHHDARDFCLLRDIIGYHFLVKDSATRAVMGGTRARMPGSCSQQSCEVATVRQADVVSKHVSSAELLKMTRRIFQQPIYNGR